MRRTFRGRRRAEQAREQQKEFRSNEQINCPEVSVIDEAGVHLGVMPTTQAIETARDRELDLVEVSPKAVPPVVRIMDYGSYRYQREKAERKAKAKVKTIEVKTVKISLRISEHDLETRVGRAVRFLSDNDKVKIELQLRGRENQHNTLAREQMKTFIERVNKALDKTVKIEQDIGQQGGRLSMIITL